MSRRNAYFQLEIKEDGTYIKLYPPVEGGAPLDINEIKQYLTSRKYTPDIIAINTKITPHINVCEVKLTDERGYKEMESLDVKMSDDGMTAYARFYCASVGGEAYTAAGIANDLVHKGVKHGISKEAIEDYLADKHYCTDYIIAMGTPVTEGKDGRVKYNFNTELSTKPTLNSDGTVDYFNLNTISKCAKGQVLAELEPEERGADGINVMGVRIRPKEVKRAFLKYGRNITLSEDGKSIISDVNGHVSLVEDKVFVSDVYEVKDVDPSTGNIDYEGDILIMGNVTAGFSVKSSGNIEIRGVVEGANVEAAGNITIAKGMNGMSKGSLKAGGNICVKFLENASVFAGGYVYTETILHSEVSAKGNIDVNGKRGLISGSIIQSLGFVSARFIGSTMGGKTEISVGVDPELKKKMVELQTRIAAANKSLTQIEPILATLTKKMKSGDKLTGEQTLYLKQLAANYSQLKPQLASDMEELENLTEAMDSMTSDSYIKVSEYAYPGTVIRISDISVTLDKPTQHCRFVKDGADIRVSAF